MTKKTIKIQIPSGLEARPVALLVQVASQYESDIYVECSQKRVNAKSIMGMMTLGLVAGEEVTVSACGNDEDEAIINIEKYLSSKQVIVSVWFYGWLKADEIPRSVLLQGEAKAVGRTYLFQRVLALSEKAAELLGGYEQVAKRIASIHFDE